MHGRRTVAEVRIIAFDARAMAAGGFCLCRPRSDFLEQPGEAGGALRSGGGRHLIPAAVLGLVQCFVGADQRPVERRFRHHGDAEA
ncbi:hypothetical protein GCM10027277_36640 [Pseudoduganella ginsengisoli]